MASNKAIVLSYYYSEKWELRNFKVDLVSNIFHLLRANPTDFPQMRGSNAKNERWEKKRQMDPFLRTYVSMQEYLSKVI